MNYGSGEHMFGAGRGRVSDEMRDRIDNALAGTGVSFQNPALPDGQRYWFSATSKGHPFDQRTERAAWAALRDAGIDPDRLIDDGDEDEE